MEKKSVKLPVEAVKTINEILERGGDVLIRYFNSKDEIVIYDQCEKVRKRITTE